MDSSHSVVHTTKTLIESKLGLSGRLPVTFNPDMDCTLNSLYNVYQAVQPVTIPKIQYFGIGIGGKYNITDTDLSEAYKPETFEMNLAKPIPFRCLPEDEDSLLTSTERAKYRMRVLQTFGGVKYYCYYLKKMEFTDEVGFIYTDPVTQKESAYILDPTNLRPTRKKPSTSGLVDATLSEITTCAVAKATITGEEVVEAINVLYEGDLRYAVLSELGIYSGEDKLVEAFNYQGVPFSYQESMCTFMSAVTTWLGTDMSHPSAIDNRRILVTEGSVYVVGDTISG